VNPPVRQRFRSIPFAVGANREPLPGVGQEAQNSLRADRSEPRAGRMGQPKGRNDNLTGMAQTISGTHLLDLAVVAEPYGFDGDALGGNALDADDTSAEAAAQPLKLSGRSTRPAPCPTDPSGLVT
jgi:hypothetical protein